MAGTDSAQRDWVARVLGVALAEAAGARPTMAAPGGRKIVFAQARLRYDAARKQVAAGIDTLMAAMRKRFADEPDFATIDSAIELFAILKEELDNRLIDALDTGYTATTPQAEAASAADAAGIVAEYQAFYKTNARLLDGLDANPFVPIRIEGVLSEALQGLAAELQHFGAS